MKQDERVRERMLFETTSVIKRAIRARAGLENISAADVINAALERYLVFEITHVEKHLQELGEINGIVKYDESVQ